MPNTLESRFWAKVNQDGPVPVFRPELGPCWPWTAGQNDSGYGQFWSGGQMVRAHRFAYELLVGPIPDGLHIDHLCRVRHCVNTGHMEPVTQQENTLRGEDGKQNRAKTHCPQGHSYDSENTHRWNGRRHCRACVRERSRERRANKRRELKTA